MENSPEQFAVTGDWESHLLIHMFACSLHALFVHNENEISRFFRVQYYTSLPLVIADCAVEVFGSVTLGKMEAAHGLPVRVDAEDALAGHGAFSPAHTR